MYISFQEKGTKFTGSGKDKNGKDYDIEGEILQEKGNKEDVVKEKGNKVSGFIAKQKEQYRLEFSGLDYNKEGTITLIGEQKIYGFNEID